MSTQAMQTHSANTLKFRTKAFFIHLALSVTVALISLYIVFWVWHPSPLGKAVGVTSIFLMMLAIDAILGPILTFIVAKPNKKFLKFDLAVIVTLQLCAYFYGMYNIAMSRPAWIVFDTMRFEVVQANELVNEDINPIEERFSHASWLGPKYVAVELPKNFKEQSDRVFSELQTGVAASKRPSLYTELDNLWGQIENKQHPLSDLGKYNDSEQIKLINNKYPNATGWFMLKAYEDPMVVLVDTEQKKIVKIVDLNPN